MDKNTIIVFVIFVLLLSGVVVLARSTQLNNPAVGANVEQGNGSLISSEKLYDFGTISMAQGKVSHIFKISNPTEKDITVAGLITSCMCTEAYIIKKDGSKTGPFGMPGMGHAHSADEIVKAGDTIEIEAVYDPNAHGPAGVGVVDRVVELTESGGGTLRLGIRAMVTP